MNEDLQTEIQENRPATAENGAISLEETSPIGTEPVKKRHFGFRRNEEGSPDGGGKKHRGGKKRKWLLLAAIVLIAAAGLAYWHFRSDSAKTETTYTEEDVTRRTITQSLTGSGTLEPANSYTVTTLKEGDITSADFEEGDSVEDGTVLYQIDSSDASTSIEKAQISLNQAKRSYNTTVEKAYVKASVSGSVYSLDVSVGDEVSQGQTIATIRNSSVMYLFYNLLTAQNSSGTTYATSLGYTVTDGQVDYATVVEDSLSGPYVCGSTAPSLSFTPTAVYRNGVSSTLSAITQYDVYYYNANLGTVWMYTDRVAGTISAISPSVTAPTSVTVNGTSYTLSTAAATYKLSALSGVAVGDTVMLVVMFTYAGFEVIGLAASEAKDPRHTIPKAIRSTVAVLVGLYVVFMILLLPLVPTEQVDETTSPLVLALQKNGLSWAGNAMTVPVGFPGLVTRMAFVCSFIISSILARSA